MHYYPLDDLYMQLAIVHTCVAMEQIKPAAMAANATHTSLAYKNKPIFVFQEEIIPQTAWLLKVNVYQCMDALKA